MEIKRKKIAFLLMGVFLSLPFSLLAFSYTPMEKIPGYSGSNDFPAYLVGLYNFGIAAIGIAALLMIMLGAYMYITSAGNNSQMRKAKGVITDALIGVLMALTAWLILYEINPELTKVMVIKGTLPGSSGGGGSTPPGTGTTKAACEKWCVDAQGNDSWTTSCKSGCAENSESPVKATNQEECEKWCVDAQGNDSWTTSCKKGCSSGSTTKTADCSNLNPALIDEINQADNGVPPALLAAFMRRECPPGMSNSGACGTNNSYGAGGSMQFLTSTWNGYGCTGNKFNRQDALRCAAKKISKDSGGDYSETGIRLAAKKYCGSCTNREACGGDYCDGIMSNYNTYKNCSGW